MVVQVGRVVVARNLLAAEWTESSALIVTRVPSAVHVEPGLRRLFGSCPGTGSSQQCFHARHCHHRRLPSHHCWGCGRARFPCLRLRPPRHRCCCQNQPPAVLPRQVCHTLTVAEVVMTRAPVKSQQPPTMMLVDREACCRRRTVWATRVVASNQRSCWMSVL